MLNKTRFFSFLIIFVAAVFVFQHIWAEQSKTNRFFNGTPPNPVIQAMVDSVSVDSLRSYLEKLITFHTRHTNSDTTSPDTGIGAARNWIISKFDAFAAQTGGGLDAKFFVFPATVCGEFNEFHKNVMATVPGTRSPERHFIVSGHMDSRMEDNCNPTALAHGANDDGSGTALSIEMARVISKFANQIESTLIMMTVTGEEQGLVGSGAYADYALANNLRIDGMITNDIVGGIVGCVNPACPNGNFITDSTSVRHFSGGTSTSTSRQLARYMKLKGEQYVTDVNWIVNLIPALDRPGRGGDHIPFFDNGYPAVRFTEAHEYGDGSGNNGHQHNGTDLIEYVNFPYMARVVKTNLAGLAILAMAPETPTASLTVRDVGSGSELFLQWERRNTEPDFAGYRVAWRHADSLFYENIIFVGDTTQSIIGGLTPEQPVYISYSALDTDGNESVFSEEVLATPRDVPAAPQHLSATSTPTDVQLSWQPNTELDLLFYRVRREDPAGNVILFEVNSTATQLNDGSVQPHVRYEYTVTAIDNLGLESPLSNAVPGQLATHDRGILLLDMSRDGVGNIQLPSDQQVDDFYDAILDNFTIAEQWDLADSAAQERLLSDADLGVYSTVVLHSDVRLRLRQLSADSTALRKYLQNGGRLLLSGWQLLSSFSGNNLADKDFQPGEFVYDILKVDAAFGVTDGDFKGATPATANSGYPEIAVDSLKFPLFGGALNATEAIQTLVASPQTEANYHYISVLDPPSPYDGLTSGLRYYGSDYSLILFNFPLYYMDEAAARQAVTQALLDLGEVTGIGDAPGRTTAPERFELRQNYPNPFNPATTIGYHLPISGKVTLTIFNLLGEKIATLVDENQPAGSHSVEWNGKDTHGRAVSSGVYLYKMETENAVKIRKLVLVR